MSRASTGKVSQYAGSEVQVSSSSFVLKKGSSSLRRWWSQWLSLGNLVWTMQIFFLQMERARADGGAVVPGSVSKEIGRDLKQG